MSEMLDNGTLRISRVIKVGGKLLMMYIVSLRRTLIREGALHICTLR